MHQESAKQTDQRVSDSPPPDAEVVVIGSGFGGAVVAARLAAQGRQVVVFERGKKYPPGSFARTPYEMSRNFWDPSEGLYGLFDFWSFRGLEGLVSSGLGGGSLIYANVLIRKDENWFVERKPDGSYEPWPLSRADLEPYYDAAEEVLRPVPYPLGEVPYSETSKTHAFRDAAMTSGAEWFLPGLAVSFAAPGAPPRPGDPFPDTDNIHGARRSSCRLIGECDIGCNFGSKNSVDFNYLTQAHKDGASIHCLTEVLDVEPVEGGYRVSYRTHDEGSRARPGPSGSIRSPRVVLAAGTFGTPLLLLKGKQRGHLPALSSALGSRFCGNGDTLGFVRNARTDGDVRRLNAELGPVITSTIRVPDEADGGRGRGFYIQDGGVPGLVNWLVEASAVSLRRTVAFALRRLWIALRGGPESNYSAEISAVLGDTARSSSWLPMLGMGRDIPDGLMSLRDGKFLDIDWTTKTSAEFFKAVRTCMRSLAEAMGGAYRDNPIWALRRVITVHPLGGAPMGVTPEAGVVDAWGRVFGHAGLYVADGSAMPGPVGPNPSLTIAAFAERVAAGILDENT